MEAFISVVIPTYNRKKLTLEAIRSVLQQEPKNYEVIVVDDGSIDGTKEYLDSLGLPITVVQANHKGISGARNIGIKTAIGKYIAFLDSDDIWLPRILTEQLNYLESHPEIPLVYVDQFIEADNKRLEKTRFNSEQTTHEQKTKFDKPGFITPQASIHASAVMVRKSIFDEVGLFNEELKIHEDTDMWNRISEKYPLGYIEKPLSVFRWEIDPEHALKPESRQLFLSEGKKYMRLYEDRHKKNGTEENYASEIKESYKKIDALTQLVALWKAKQITEEEFQKRKANIFT